MRYVYILQRGNDKKWHIGYTGNLKRMLVEHRTKWQCSLVYCEVYSSERLARNRERKLKYYGSAWRGHIKRIMA